MYILKKGSSERGFTLVEMLIALFIAAAAMAAVMQVYTSFMKHTSSQELLIDAQQDARAGIGFISKELVQIGHRVDSGFDAISTITSTELTFRYLDPTETDTTQNQLMITYKLDAGNLKRQRCVQTNWAGCADTGFHTVIENVASLDFDYYQADSATTTDPTLIRFIKAALTIETRENLPNLSSPAKGSYTVRTEARLRNIDIQSIAAVSSAPAAPTGLQAREVEIGGRSGICGQLKLKWLMGGEADLAGYKIQYSVGGGFPVIITKSLASLGVEGGTHYTYTLTGLTSSLSNGSSTTTYSIVVKGYNAAGKAGPASNAVPGAETGNPDPSNYTFDADENDTTINPAKPTAITGLAAADGAEGEVVLSWNAYDTATNPGVTGFRVFRNTTSFSAYPVAEVGSITWEAGVPGDAKYDLLPTDIEYRDSDAVLVGCETFYYTVAPVNCDATLVTDDGGDPATKKYIVSDYMGVCGDGTGSCTPGTGLAASASQDTTPDDTTPPGVPTLSERADGTIVSGYKRTYIAFDNPTDIDFSHSIIQYDTNTGADTNPTVDITVGSGTYGDIFGGHPVPDTNNMSKVIKGYFEGTGLTVSFVHDSEWDDSREDVNTMHEPRLEDLNYYYTSVAYDKCGNPASDSSTAETVATLCGDGSVGEPEYGSPEPATNTAVSGCTTTNTVTWVNNVVDADNDPDTAGHRIYRAPTATFNTGLLPSDLNGTPCASSPNAPCFLGFIAIGYDRTFSDSYGLEDGATYSYGIVTADCVYQERWLALAEATFDSNNSTWNTYNGENNTGVKPGEILRDEKLSVSPDSLHREVLTGVYLNNAAGSGDGSTTPSLFLTHGKVTLFFKNTSAGPQTIESASVKWVNTAAKLRNITIGGGESGEDQASGSTDVAVVETLTDSDDPYTRKVVDVDLSGAPSPAPEIDGNAENVPITFTFWNITGGAVDMRDDQLLIELEVKNESTGDTDCLSFLTTNEAYEGVVVPFGPIVGNSSDDGGVYQENPGAAAYADGNGAPPVTGGTDYAPVAATGGSDVVVSTTIVGGSSDHVGGTVGVSSANIYWAETDMTDGTAPTLPGDYTAEAMSNTAGNVWEGTIPEVGTTPSRIWYYIVAIDDDGNFDRKPEVDEGYYVYDQKPFDACDVTPNAPATLEHYYYNVPFDDTQHVSHVNVKWPSVTTYVEGGTASFASDPLVYQIWRRDTVGGAYQKVFEVAQEAADDCVVDPVGPSVAPAVSSWRAICDTTTVYYWGDEIDPVANDVSYYVVAENSCSADTNTSDPSPVYRECTGSLDGVITVSAASVEAGGSYTITVQDCGDAIDPLVNTITITSNAAQGGSYGPVLTETSASSGTYTSTVDTYFGAGAGDLLVAPTIALDDTITVSCAGCSGAPANKTITVTPSPCQDAPAAPSNFAGTKSGQVVTLTWTANAEADMDGYELWRSNDNGATWGSGAVATISNPATTTIDDNPPGSLNSYDYKYYLVAVDTCPLDSAASDEAGPF